LSFIAGNTFAQEVSQTTEVKADAQLAVLPLDALEQLFLLHL
jgi:hypothetical protein